jgi:hypothetical protein
MNENQFDDFVKSKGPVFYEAWIKWQENLITQANYIDELDNFLTQHGKDFGADQVKKLRTTLLDSASTDLNKLYTVIHRSGRLKILLESQAPDIMVNNERRLLQEAIDAL